MYVAEIIFWLVFIDVVVVILVVGMLHRWLERSKLQHCIPACRLCAVQLTEQQSTARHIGWPNDAQGHNEFDSLEKE